MVASIWFHANATVVSIVLNIWELVKVKSNSYLRIKIKKNLIKLNLFLNLRYRRNKFRNVVDVNKPDTTWEDVKCLNIKHNLKWRRNITEILTKWKFITKPTERNINVKKEIEQSIWENTDFKRNKKLSYRIILMKCTYVWNIFRPPQPIQK